MNHTLIGIDCATQPARVGLARATLGGGKLRIDAVMLGSELTSIPATIASWFTESTLLALDAPLGWPAPLAEAIATHSAGAPLRQPRELLFNRHTDRLIHQRIGKKPLDVGADRIARTAHAALTLLAQLGKLNGSSIPLAWIPGADPLAAIETYPAATFLKRGCSLRGYKRNDKLGRAAKQAIVDAIDSEASLGVDRDVLLANDDALDAVGCVLAGADFLRGQALGPEPNTIATAKREGWIWLQA